MLVFAGTGAIIVDDLTGSISHVGIALTFGLVVLAVIYAIGDLSGAHINPAVTIAFWAARRFPLRYVPGYVVSQVGGAVVASLLWRSLYPAQRSLGATLPAVPPFQALVLEIILTWFLMWVILHVSSGALEKGITAGIAVGAVVALEALFAGPITGASMNPARSVAPALVSGNLRHMWIYVIAPTIGALLAVALHYILSPTSQSPARSQAEKMRL